MSHSHETAALLHYPAAASHFQPPPPRSSEWKQGSRQPYQALHIQHRNAFIEQQQQRDRDSERRQQQQDGYTFAPHSELLLYDVEDDDGDERTEAQVASGSSEEDSAHGEQSLQLQRVQHSTQQPANGDVSLHSNKQRTQHGKQRQNGGRVMSAASAASDNTLGPLSHTSYGSTAQSGAVASHGRRGESQSQPHSPIESPSRNSNGYQLSALQQQHGRHEALDSSGSSLAAIKTLDHTPSSSPTRSVLSASSHPVRLAVYLLLSVVVAVANAITWKRTLNRFRATDGSAANLEFFVTQWTILLYVLLAAVILTYRWLYTPLITDEQKAYPQRKFALMGLMDAVAGLCSSLGGAFTSGQTQVILNQFNIPVTMLLSRYFLASRYTLAQYIGAGLIVAGSLLAAAPSTGGSDGAGSSTTLWYGSLIVLLSCLPNSCSNCYKEHNFKVDGLDVYYLTTFVSVWQVLLGFVFCPILSLPGLGGLSLSDIPHNFAAGWSCFVGEYVEGFDCHLSPPPSAMLLLYVAVNFVLNVLLLLITKHGSALLLVIASAISMPFTNLVFTSELVMGREAERWSWWTGGGLAVVVVGFLLYALVTDAETGDWLPAQGAAGQMAFIVEQPVELLELHKSFQRTARRHSFDVTDSPLVLAHSEERKRAAKQRFLQQRRSSRATEAAEAATDATDEANRGSVSDRLFFTPP